jgi:hypothetical protein
VTPEQAGGWISQHATLLFAAGVALLLFYLPPAITQRLQGLGDFVSRHWGDSIGLYLIHLGILLVILGGFYSQLTNAEHVGESFILTGVGLLKLKYNPPVNGNGTSPDHLEATLVPANGPQNGERKP